MSTGPTISLALIVRNEEQGLRDILPQIRTETFDDVFAVDGSSTDGSVEILRSHGICVLQQQKAGLGAAMIQAREHLRTDALIFFHPDGNEDPSDLERMASLLRQGTQFVIASRMIRGSINEDDHKILKWRKWANQGFAILANTFFAQEGNRTSDVTNGFRGITAAAWDQMKLSSHDLTMDYQMVIRALKTGVKITEFPTHEGRRIDGATNFASLPTGIAELKLLWREIRMRRRDDE